jgi:hypothetical protein
VAARVLKDHTYQKRKRHLRFPERPRGLSLASMHSVKAALRAV